MTINQKKFTTEEIKIFIILTLMATSGLLGVDIHISTLPIIMKYMHTNESHIQQTVSIFLLGIGSSQIIYGPLSDKYGRKPIVIFGLALAAFSNFLAFFTLNIYFFLALRLLQGIGSGVCIGVGRTIAADIAQGEKYAIVTSYMSLFISLSPLIAPILGSYIQSWFGWQFNFILMGLIISVVLCLFIFLFKETNKYKNKDACSPAYLYQNYKSIISNRTVILCTILAGIGMSISMIYATISPFIFQIHFNTTAIKYGHIVFLTAIGGVLGKLLSPVLIRRLSSRNTLFIGLIILIISGIMTYLFIKYNFANITTISLCAFIAMICPPFILPHAASKVLSKFHINRGAVGAIYGCFQMLVAFLLNFLVGIFSQDNLITMAICYTALGVIGTFIFFQIKQES